MLIQFLFQVNLIPCLVDVVMEIYDTCLRNRENFVIFYSNPTLPYGLCSAMEGDGMMLYDALM